MNQAIGHRGAIANAEVMNLAGSTPSDVERALTVRTGVQSSESLDFIIDTLKRIAVDTARMAGAPATPTTPGAAQEGGT